MVGRRTAIVVTHSRLATSPIVSEAVERLEAAGFTVRLVDNPNDNLHSRDSRDVLDAGADQPLSAVTVGPQAMTGLGPAGADADGGAAEPGASGPGGDSAEIVVVLGGDGTILRAAELVKGTDIPILGVNLGHVGFLAEFESFQISEAIRRVAARDYQIEERRLAGVSLRLPGQTTALTNWALNDVTVEKADRSKMIELCVKVDDVEMSSYGADGVIVSTPTGSTAYAFSAGGPIIWPDAAVLQLTPLAAHALFTRPLIIGPDSRFQIDILPDSASEGWISYDGRRAAQLPRGTAVSVGLSTETLKLVRLSEAPFTSRLVSKFNLPVAGWRANGQGRVENAQ